MKKTKMQMVYDVIATLADEEGIARFHYADIAGILSSRGVKLTRSAVSRACKKLVAKGKLTRLTPDDRSHGAVYRLSKQWPVSEVPAHLVVIADNARAGALALMDCLAKEYIECTDAAGKAHIAQRSSEITKAFVLSSEKAIIMEITIPLEELAARLRAPQKSKATATPGTQGPEERASVA